ncbi:MAG: PQQ-dependent sugar dehydrogenase [Acidobacteriia bacterium]|nr:PQQ-dependent sugar dehydrogenase [Terriglobia bacterium]
MKKTILLSCLVLSAVWAQKKITLPDPGPSAANRPQVIARPDGANLSVPKGFTVEEYATGFEKPRYMTVGPGGEVLVSDSVANGSVWVIQGKGKEKRKLISGLDRPFGMAFWKDYLYVAEPTSLKRYKYDAKAMTAGPGEEVVPMKGFDKGHWTRSVIFDAKGEKMYLTIGSGSNVDAGDPPERAAIHRYNPDGTGGEAIAGGLRNAVSIRFYPGTSTLWATVQERDGLGDDLVPDFFTSIQKGGFYGWPYAYIGPNEEPRRKGENPELVKKTLTPDLLLPSHVAVMDAVFYTGRQFPKQYQGGAFLALRGSSNRSKRVGYSVVYVPFKNGKPAGQPQDFLTGWMKDPEQREVWGRPVGLLQLPDGSLLVTDDEGGKRIWRISYKG